MILSERSYRTVNTGKAKNLTNGFSFSKRPNKYIITIAINSCKLQLKGHVNPLILPVQVGRVNTRRKSGIPRSTGTSREASPSRYGAARGVRTAHGRPGARPLLTEQILRQSQEAESALADALVSLYDSSCLPSLASSLD